MSYQRGSDRHHSKANDWLVRKIRENRYGWSRRYWSQLTGISKNTIESIATYRTWKHVD